MEETGKFSGPLWGRCLLLSAAEGGQTGLESCSIEMGGVCGSPAADLVLLQSLLLA